MWRWVFREGVGVLEITMRLDQDVLPALRRSPDGFANEMRLAAAIHWYKRGEISQETAAEVAGLDRTDFLLALVREGENAFVVDFADLERELQRGLNVPFLILRESKEPTGEPATKSGSGYERIARQQLALDYRNLSLNHSKQVQLSAASKSKVLRHVRNDRYIVLCDVMPRRNILIRLATLET